MNDLWERRLLPLTYQAAQEIAKHDLRDEKIAIHGHLYDNLVPIVTAFVSAGASVSMASCSTTTGSPSAVERMQRAGAIVFWPSERTEAQFKKARRALIGSAPTVVSDIGGEVISHFVTAGRQTVKGALEATISGINHINSIGVASPFPIYDWNSIAMKDQVHNRFHVGYEFWFSFGYVTSMSLLGRNVVIIGFGSVGQGIAQYAKALGAKVAVVERDPARSGPVTLLCRPKCLFRPLSVRRRSGFSNPVLSGVVADCRSRLCS